MTAIDTSTDVDQRTRLMASADHFNTPLGADGTPHDYFEALRDEAEETPIAWSESHGGHWVVAGYHAVVEIMNQAKTFSNKGVTFPRYETGDFELMMAGQDDPIHKKYRNLVAQPFSPQVTEQFSEQLRQTTNDLIDERIELGEADIASWLADEIPARLTAILLGIPPEDGDKYRRWVHSITHVENLADAAPVFGEMVEHARELIALRRESPGDDVMSRVVQAEIDGERLSDDEAVGFFIILLLGGIDNTARFLSSVFWRLAWDKDLRRRLISHPELLPLAVDELLRFYSPAMVGRLVLEKSVTVGDVTMEEGQTAFLWFPVANRDRSMFANPDNIVLDRSPNRHLALGQGIHRCLGAHLIKVEARVAITELLRRLPEFELDPTKKSEWLMGQVSGMQSVPIVFPRGARLRD
ncbi:cytochrome P450 [Nocardioides sp. YJ-D4]